MNKTQKKDKATPKRDLESYFKIGVSDEYILIRDDFPIDSVSPGDFSKLLITLFQKNDEARRNGK
jgi:hypothetical protein